MKPQIKILIDNIEVNDSNITTFHNILSHVPQNIHLNDDTILNNIALSNEINLDEIKECGESFEEILSTFQDSYYFKMQPVYKKTFSQ